jgi:hypothetical protein
MEKKRRKLEKKNAGKNNKKKSRGSDFIFLKIVYPKSGILKMENSKNSQFKPGLSQQLGVGNRRESNLSIRKNKRNQKLAKRRFIDLDAENNNIDENDPLQNTNGVSKDAFINLISNFKPHLIVNAKSISDCDYQINGLVDIIRYLGNKPVGETITSLTNDGLHPGASGNFIISLPGVVRALVKFVATPQTEQNKEFQRKVILILLRLTYNQEQRKWTNILLDMDYAPIAYNHLSTTEDQLTRNYILVTLGNIAIDSNNHRDRLMGNTELLLSVIRKNVQSVPRNTIWFLRTLFFRKPVPPYDIMKHVWDIIKKSICQTFVEEKIHPEQIDCTEAALILIQEAIRSENPGTFMSYISAVCNDKELMEKLFYFVKHKHTPLGICQGSIAILKLLTKHHGELAQLVNVGYIPVMLHACEHQNVDVRSAGLMGIKQFAKYPETIRLLCSEHVIRMLYGRIQFETRLPREYALVNLAEMIYTLCNNGMHKELHMILSFKDQNPSSGIYNLSAIHNLCEAFKSEFTLKATNVRVCNALNMLIKMEQYKEKTLIDMEEMEADEYLNTKYAQTSSDESGLLKQYEKLIDALNGQDELGESGGERMDLSASVGGGFNF